MAKLPKAESAAIVRKLEEIAQNPFRAWREYRALSQQALAAAVGISPSYLSQLETGRRTGTADVLNSIATELKIDLEDLV